MKTMRVALAAAFLLTSALSAQAAEYAHFTAATWRIGIVDFLKKFQPDPTSVTGGISGQYDVHVYCVKGQFTGTYSLLFYPKHPTDRANLTIQALVDGGNAKIFGFVGEDVYVLTWTKQ